MFDLKPAALAALVLVSPAAAHATEWRVDREASRVGFEFTQAGATNDGEFEEFEAEIVFDPDDLAGASVVAVIDVTSVSTGNADRDATVQGPEWFGAEAHPQATFESTSFEPTGGNDYAVDGTLTLKGITNPVTLPMTIAVDGASARASGTVTIDRSDYQVGTGDWAAGTVVGLEVGILLDIHATAEGGESGGS